MTKVVTKLRHLRLQAAAKRGTPLPMQEVANATGMLISRINYLELGKFERIDTRELLALSAFYSQQLDKLVDIADILSFDEQRETPLAV
ncbi:MAG: hypothetical protein EI684_04400 [Candidatus Viridilinea halotolerans]|uniref:XRE family transcriptional regulator n=1 Tax=Candidatus Viridilinea halotolerans TaxID=2491704 RepID=A0A426U6C4_9CHLR|nr:MAG: hypothetical protein EI684_04400 [Candidatus Viridilinea halotolerans]